ncbi:MAG: transcriptional repressor [Wenzhouxiangellaceae bacterium]
MQASELIREVEARCERDQLRLTPIRRRVLELVIEAGGPVKGYDLLDQLKADLPGAAPPTVYRALDFLLENHFIHRLESLNAYVSCFQPNRRHSGGFLICEQCGSVTEVPGPVAGCELEEVARAQGFEPSRQVLEIYGRCRRCAAGAPASD